MSKQAPSDPVVAWAVWADRAIERGPAEAGRALRFLDTTLARRSPTANARLSPEALAPIRERLSHHAR
ncbi:hypothetical protein [Brevundimonas sp. TWP2-3-4b1]|uniref:hypothetical protein n=1 Tax=Brevundimonas sp. TWP2-3-4b1 TaxID=2804580 RepID=UPI003CF35FBB